MLEIQVLLPFRKTNLLRIYNAIGLIIVQLFIFLSRLFQIILIPINLFVSILSIQKLILETWIFDWKLKKEILLPPSSCLDIYYTFYQYNRERTNKFEYWSRTNHQNPWKLIEIISNHRSPRTIEIINNRRIGINKRDLLSPQNHWLNLINLIIRNVNSIKIITRDRYYCFRVQIQRNKNERFG